MDTVTSLPSEDETAQMGLIGYVIAGCIALLLLPLVPFLLVLRLLAGRRDEPDRPDID